MERGAAATGMPYLQQEARHYTAGSEYAEEHEVGANWAVILNQPPRVRMEEIS